MNEKEKLTSTKLVEEQERLKSKYEEESKEKDETILSLQKTILGKDDEIFELQKENKKVAEEKDDWKKEAMANRKVYKENKKTQEQTSFIEEFNKLQAKKGIIINN